MLWKISIQYHVTCHRYQLQCREGRDDLSDGDGIDPGVDWDIELQ